MISLNYRDSRPIYEQIADGLRKLIVTGVYGADEKLPSVRELSSELAINPNTIQKAYAGLEREGVIYTVAGKGVFAAGRDDFAESRKAKLMEQFTVVTRELLLLTQDARELKQKIDEIKGGSDD